jgi:phenylpropionate dioxygenase-like ring-hydroxylating dioxygenase large terminal subunit
MAMGRPWGLENPVATRTARDPIQTSAGLAGVRLPLKPWPRYERAILGLRNYWYPAMLSRQLKRKPIGVQMLGEELVFVRDGEHVYCLEGRCPHRGVPLSEGRSVFPCTLSCAYHGWTYDLRTGVLVGALTDGPESAIVGKVKLRSYPVVEQQGVIWTFIGDGPPPPLEEDVPREFLDPQAVVGAQVQVCRGNWRLAMEGAIDPAHPLFLHRSAWLNLFRRLPATRGRYRTEVIDERYLASRSDPPTADAQYPGLGKWPSEPWWKLRLSAKTTTTAWLPCGVRVVGLPTNVPFETYSWYVPVDQDTYRWFQFLVARVSGIQKWWAGLKYHLWLRWLYQGQFLGQDVRINELIHPFYVNQDGWAKERLFRPDSVIIEWRKHVENSARGIQNEPRCPANVLPERSKEHSM